MSTWKALLHMADVTDGLSAQADDDHIRLSFAASRLGAMIRQFVQSYRLRSFSVAVVAANKLDEFVDAREREYLRQGVEAARILAEELGLLAVGWRAHHEASAQTEEAQPPEAGDMPRG